MKFLKKDVWYKVTTNWTNIATTDMVNECIWHYMAQKAPDMQFAVVELAAGFNGQNRATAIKTRDGRIHTAAGIGSSIDTPISHIFGDADLKDGSIVEVENPSIVDTHADERSFLLKQVITLRTALEHAEERLAQLPKL